MKRAGKLFDTLISDDNLLLAIDEVNRTHHWCKGHRPNTCTAWVEETKAERVKDLRRMLIKGFEPKPPHVSQRWDTSARKWRTISEPAQWPDQYVHHALIQALQPKMMQGMDFYCCGSIRGRGTEREKKAIERWLKYDRKGTKYEFCGDIRHFYESLTPEVVMARMRQLYKDRRVLDLIEHIIRNGIQLGTYTSQWLANAVLQPLDRLIRESGYCKHYARYMDNMTTFGPNKRKLRKLRILVEDWLNAHDLKLKGDWQVFPVAKTQRKVPLALPRRGYERTKGRLPDGIGRGEKEEDGLDHKGYLRLMLFGGYSEERVYRMMDVIQTELRTEQPDFCMAGCTCMVEMEAEFCGKPVFFSGGPWKDRQKIRMAVSGSYLDDE